MDTLCFLGTVLCVAFEGRNSLASSLGSVLRFNLGKHKSTARAVTLAAKGVL